MKVGDLVKYNPSPHKNTHYERLVGIILRFSKRFRYMTVMWTDGTCDEDLVYSELEVISESR